MATLQKVFQTLVPEAITHANDCYQEYLRGISNQDLYASIEARIVACVSGVFLLYANEKFTKDFMPVLVTGIVVPILVDMALKSYGANRGYNTDYKCEIFVVDLNQQLPEIIDRFTTPTTTVCMQEGDVEVLDYESRTDNQKRVALLLRILAGIGSSYILYKFQANRNPSLPLKSYLYFAAGATILQELQRYNGLDRKVDKATSNYLSTNIPNYYAVFEVAFKIIVRFRVAQVVGLATGQPIQMEWNWEALSSAASAAARIYFSKN